MRYSQSNIQTGWNVYDNKGDKIGSVHELFDERFVMNTGLFGLGTQYGIPYNAIDKVEGDKIYLNTTHDHLSSYLDQAETSGRPMAGTRGGSTRDDDYLRGDRERTDMDRDDKSTPLSEEESGIGRESVNREEPYVEKEGDVRRLENETDEEFRERQDRLRDKR